jgi:hypothetical protein
MIDHLETALQPSQRVSAGTAYRGSIKGRLDPVGRGRASGSEVAPFLRTEFAGFLSELSAVTSYPRGGLPKVPLDRRRAARWVTHVAHAANFTAVESKYAASGVRAPSDECGRSPL